jgi:hypothetical protein
MPVAKPVISTNNPALLVRADGSTYAVGKFKPKETKDGKWDAYMQAFEATQCDGPYRLVGDQLNRLPNGFELENPTLFVGQQPIQCDLHRLGILRNPQRQVHVLENEPIPGNSAPHG